MQLTRSTGAALMAAALLVSASAATPETRPVSLEDCVQMALEHNLDLQITRISPRLAQLALSGAYSAYDPTFRAGMDHGYSQAPGGVDAQSRPYVGSQTETDTFELGVSGVLPSGTTWNIGGSVADTYGTRPGFDVDFSSPVVSTNYLTFADPFLGSYGYLNTNYLQFATADPFENANGGVGIRLSQPLLKNFWIDATRYNIAIRKKDLKNTELALKYQIMRVVTDVEVAYYNLIAALEQVKVQEQALKEAEQQLRENRKRVEVGVMAALDEKDAESQVAASRALLFAVQSNLSTAQNRLKSLITDRYGEWQDVALAPGEKLSAVPQTFSRVDSWERGLTLRPDLDQARVDLEKQQIKLKYDRNQLYPQLDITGSYGFSGSGPEFSGALDQIAAGENPSYGIGAILSFPLSNRAARYSYRATKEAIEQALLQLKKLEQDIMVQIDDSIAQARSAFEQVAATKEASLFAQMAYEAEQKKLENGKSTSFQVLVLQRILTSRRYEEISALSSYNRALAQLALSEGSTLERNRIDFEVKY